MVRPELPGDTRLRTCRNFMDGEVGAGLLFFLTHANAHKGFQAAIDDKPADERKTATGTPSREADIAVIGAGPSGMAMALLLARHGFRTALVAPALPASDDRTTALLESSVEMLRSLKLWDRLLRDAAIL